MKHLLSILTLTSLMLTTSCEHKDLCYNHPEHAHRYHINVIADYRTDWEEQYEGPNWKASWPGNYLPYDNFRPTKPAGLRVVNYNEMGEYNIHNIAPEGGVISLYEGVNDLLFYNNDTEYIVFSRLDDGASTRATTRTRTRATYMGNEYANEGEETVNPPDMLYANYFEDYLVEKTIKPTDLEVTLQPLVFTYKIRYEFESGLEYVSLVRGALTGMARSVHMNTGYTSDEAATLLYDCELTDFGARAVVMSFGVPGFPNKNYPTRSESNKHAINLEVMLRNGNIISYDFDVTDQVKAQPHGGVIVVKGIIVEEEDGMQGSGAFDVEVKDWGDYEDVELPL